MTKDIILDVQVSYKQAIDAMAELQAKIDDTKRTQAELKEEFKRGELTAQEYRKASVELTQVSKAYSAEARVYQKEIQNNIKYERAQTDSINALKASTSNLTAQFQAMSAQEQNSASGTALAKKIYEQNKALKEADAALGNFQRNVGDYENALKNATLGGNTFLTSIVNISNSGGGFSGMFKQATTALGGFAKQMWAFIASPVGAIIGGIALAIMAVKEAFTRSEEGQDKYAKLMAVIGAVGNQLLDVVATLGEKLIWIFENPKQALKDFGEMIKQNIINRFQGILEFIPAIGKAIGLLFEKKWSEAAKVAADAVGKVTLGVENVTDNLVDAKNAVVDFMAETINEGKMADKIADMRDKANDKERELIKNRAKLEAEAAELRLKAQEKDKYTSKERLKFVQDAFDIQAKIEKQELDIAVLRRDAQIAENRLGKTTEENKLEEANLIAAVYNIKAKTAQEEKAILKELNRIKKQARADDAAMGKEERDEALALLQLKLETVAKGSEQERILKIQELELTKNEELRLVEEGSEQEGLIKEKYRIKEAEINAAFRLKQQQDALAAANLEAENKLIQARINGENENALMLELKKAQLATIQQLEGESDAQFLNRKLKLEEEIKKATEQAEKDKTKIRTESNNNAVSGAQSLAETLSGLAKEGTVEQKALAITAATIQTFLGIQSAFAQTQGGIIPKIAAATVALTTGIANVKKILDVKVEGAKTSTASGINATIPNFSAVQSTPFSGAVSNISGVESINQTMGMAGVSDAIKGSLLGAKFEVSVSEINSVQNRVDVLEDLTKI